MADHVSTWGRNCDEEVVEPLRGAVQGQIPDWLRGSMVCNGPGLMQYGSQEFQHAFDGSAILQKITVCDDGVTYASKFLRSYAYNTNSHHKQIVVSEFGTAGTSVSTGLFQRFGKMFQFDKLFSDNALVAIVKISDSYFATTESPFLYKIDLETLETQEKINLHRLLKANSQCPHPQHLSDGSTVTVLSTVGAFGPQYEVVKITPTDKDVLGKVEKVGTCNTRWTLNPCHMHTFGLTDNYVVLPEQPLTIDIMALITNTFKSRPLIEGMNWLDVKDVRFHVLSLITGKELNLKLSSEVFFFMHIINCFEEKNHIILDLIVFKNSSMLHQLTLKSIRSGSSDLIKTMQESRVRRLVIPLSYNDKAAPEDNLISWPGTTARAFKLKDGTINLIPQDITNIGYENPSLNSQYERKPYTYYYGVSCNLTQNKSTVGKVNMRSGVVIEWSSEDQVYAASVVFVARPEAKAEDDGVVLVFSVNADPKKMSFFVLDATSMSELARVSFTLPCNVPRPLHAIYFPTK